MYHSVGTIARRSVFIRYKRTKNRGGIMSGHSVSIPAGKGGNTEAYKYANIFIYLFIYI